MRDDQIHLVRMTFEQIRPQSDAFAARFYQNLFDMQPAYRALFENTDMQVQREKLMGTLEVVVANLYDLPIITRAIINLGVRHLEYGVPSNSYETAGEALLKTLQDTLGSAFDAEARQSWQYAYDMVAFLMKASKKAE